MYLSEQEVVTDINKSPLILILAWFFLSVCVLATIARTGTKLSMIRGLRLDDYTAIGATFLAVLQSICIVVAGNNGAGKHMDVLSEGQVSAILKAEYASNLFYILSLAVAKISILVMVTSLTPRAYHNIIYILQGISGVWGLAGVLTAAFQCGLPSPWDFNKGTCINRGAFWTGISVSNIVTDLLIIFVIIQSVMRIQTSFSKKMVVIGVFASRIFVIPAVACQIYYDLATFSSSDPTFDSWPARVTIQVVQVLSIVTACMPILKPFLDSLESGQIRSDDLRRQGKSAFGYNSHIGTPFQSHVESGGKRSNAVMNSLNSRLSKMHELTELPKSKRASTVQDQSVRAWDSQSHTSQKMLIQQTKSWKIQVEERKGGDDLQSDSTNSD